MTIDSFDQKYTGTYAICLQVMARVARAQEELMSELSNDLSKLSQASTDYIQSKKTMLINGAEREASDGKTFNPYKFNILHLSIKL